MIVDLPLPVPSRRRSGDAAYSGVLDVTQEQWKHLSDRELLLLVNQRLLEIENRFDPIERWVEDTKAQVKMLVWGWGVIIGIAALAIAARAIHFW